MAKKIAPVEESASNCRQVSTQAELDKALAGGACVHVRGDAEQSVLDWQDANHVEPEIAGKW